MMAEKRPEQLLLATVGLCFLALATVPSWGFKIRTPDEKFLLRVLPGNWKENQDARENLNSFLLEMGMNWFKRMYVTSSSWENEQHINIDDVTEVIKVEEIRGPHKSKVQFTLTPDNTTVSLVDLEELGGLTNATSSIKGTSMITYLRKKDSKSVFLIVTRTLFKDDENKMRHETKHLASNVSLVSHFKRMKK